MASNLEKNIRKTVTRFINSSAALNRQLKNPLRKHLFLTGIHEPMRDELSIDKLTVSGEIPAALHGVYARIGPNPFKPDPRGHHWFVGDGMVHGIRLSNGKRVWQYWIILGYKQKKGG